MDDSDTKHDAFWGGVIDMKGATSPKFLTLSDKKKGMLACMQKLYGGRISLDNRGMYSLRYEGAERCVLEERLRVASDGIENLAYWTKGVLTAGLRMYGNMFSLSNTKKPHIIAKLKRGLSMVFPNMSITGGPGALKVYRAVDREKLLRWLPGPFDDDVDSVPFEPLSELYKRSYELSLAWYNAGTGKVA